MDIGVGYRFRRLLRALGHASTDALPPVLVASLERVAASGVGGRRVVRAATRAVLGSARLGRSVGLALALTGVAAQDAAVS